LEDLLHESDIDESELGDERNRYCPYQHFVLEKGTPESSILNGGDQVKEDEAGKCLRRNGY